MSRSRHHHFVRCGLPGMWCPVSYRCYWHCPRWIGCHGWPRPRYQSLRSWLLLLMQDCRRIAILRLTPKLLHQQRLSGRPWLEQDARTPERAQQSPSLANPQQWRQAPVQCSLHRVPLWTDRTQATCRPKLLHQCHSQWPHCRWPLRCLIAHRHSHQ